MANGSASVVYVLPAGLAAGTYTIKTEYSGSGNFAASTDTRSLVINAAATASAVASANATFGDVNVTLNVAITSPAGVVDGGTATFTILDGTTVIGSAVAVAVANGSASAVYVLPAGLAAGTYTIRTEYSGSGNFAASTDTSQTLIVSAAATASAAASASATFGDANVTLDVTITSPTGVVDGGTATFTILDGTTVIGSAVAVAVANGSASVVYVLPAGLAAGTYTIKTEYSGSGNFAPSSDTSQSLIVSAAATASAAASATATFGDVNVTLNVAITSPAGVVDSGTATFTILDGTTVIGSAVAVAVANGAASVVYVLPAGLAAGTYTIQTEYSGTGNFAPSTDTSQTLVVSAAATASAAASATANFGDANVTLDMTITSPAGVVNGGTATFTILDGTTVIGSAVAVAVANGAASVVYVLPAGLAAGTYSIKAEYSGSGNFAASADTSQTLIVSAAATASAAASANATFGDANVTLNVAITSPAGIVDGGTATFTILDGTTVIGSAVAVAVANGAASVVYVLPAGLAVGTYTIKTEYSGSGNFAPSSDSSHNLILAAAASATATASTTAEFRVAEHVVALSATVASTAGTVDAGTLTFTILSGTTVVGSPVTAAVVAGALTADYLLPAGLAAGTYTIKAEYNGTPDFGGSTDTDHILTIAAAATATAAADVSVPFRSVDRSISLDVAVSSPAGTVNEGTATVTLLDGTLAIGSPVTVAVANGAATVDYILPAGTPTGAYTIQVAYNGTSNFEDSTDNAHHLTINAPSIIATATAVQWGSQTATLQPATDGVRLLPEGRTQDLPWFNIDRIAITFSQAAELSPSDVHVVGIAGGDYGPVTISGSGTVSILLTLAKPIAVADRVTLMIGSDEIITYTRRLDVLPGDANDDGAVNTTDGVLILRNSTPAHDYQVSYDMNGDAAANTADFVLYRPRIGTQLPGLPPQLVAGGVGLGGVARLTTDELAPVLKTAIDRWAAAGISTENVARLREVQIQIADLPAGYLGGTVIGGTTIYISADAAGHGWYVDSTTGTNSSFAFNALAAESAGHEDLLTVVMHELGHTLGLDDLDPASYPDDLMAETLETGVRRLPSARDVVAVEESLFGTASSPTNPALIDAVLGTADQVGWFLSPPPSHTEPEIILDLGSSRRKTPAKVLRNESRR